MAHCKIPATDQPFRTPTGPLDVGLIYDFLPRTERTLLRHYRQYPFHIANDRGDPCAWYIYDDSANPIGVIHYYRGTKLVSYTKLVS